MTGRLLVVVKCKLSHFACCLSCSNRERGFAGAAGFSFSTLATSAKDVLVQGAAISESPSQWIADEMALSLTASTHHWRGGSESAYSLVTTSTHFACCLSCPNRESGFAGVAGGAAGLSFSALAAGAADGASIRRVLFMAV